MQKSTARTLALVAVPLLLLSACSDGISNAEADACEQVQVWKADGQEPDGFAETVAKTQDSLSDVDDSPLTDAVATLAASSETEQAANADSFLEVCFDLGWELTEG